MAKRIGAAIGLFGILVSASAEAAAPAKDCEVMAYLIQQARIDFDTIRGKQISKGRCSSRGKDFACAWAFPGDGYGFAEEETDRLKKCVAAYPTAQKVAGKAGATLFSVEPDVLVTIPAPEIDSNGNWAVGFKIGQVED